MTYTAFSRIVVNLIRSPNILNFTNNTKCLQKYSSSFKHSVNRIIKMNDNIQTKPANPEASGSQTVDEVSEVKISASEQSNAINSSDSNSKTIGTQCGGDHIDDENIVVGKLCHSPQPEPEVEVEVVEASVDFLNKLTPYSFLCYPFFVFKKYDEKLKAD